MSARSKRITAAALLGLPIKQYGSTHKWGLYDGKRLHVSSSYPIMDIDHEIGHLLAASPGQRAQPEFGLGRGPSYPDDDQIEKFRLPAMRRRTRGHSSRRGSLFPDRKEAMASLFGIAVTYVFGKPDEWRKHASSHNWDDAVHACDMFCLIKPTEHHRFKNRLAQALARLQELKARL